MKKLTISELFEAPSVIRDIYIDQLNDQKIDEDKFDLAIKAFPEFFEDEIEIDERMAMIPKKVKALFSMELEIAKERIIRDYGTGDRGQKYLERLQKGLIRKHFKVYGIK